MIGAKRQISDKQVSLDNDVFAIGQLPIVVNLLNVICKTTGMRFAAIAKVTESRWITCTVHDEINFGLKPGDELQIKTIICDEIRQSTKPIVIGNVANDPDFCNHYTPALYGFKSYISVPIIRKDGSFFGTLCAIDPEPKQLSSPEVVSMFNLFSDLISFHLNAFDEIKSTEKLLHTEMSLHKKVEASEERLQSEQKFRLLADSMPQHIWIGDPSGNLNYFNSSVFNYSGLTLEQIEKDGWIQIVHPDDRERNIKLWTESIATGKDFLIEHRFRRHDGEYRWQLSRAIPQRDTNGKIQMWVGTSTEIHNQKTFANELEGKVQDRTQQLEDKNKELEKMNKELQSFAYISSHDLQEPLRKIQTFASRILETQYDTLNSITKDYFFRMQSAANRMQTLIDDLLAYSRTNTFERKYEQINLGDIVNEVVSDLKEELHQSHGTVVATELCNINIIPFQFRQLLQNLITNSLKFSDPNRPPFITITSEIAKGAKFEIPQLDNQKMYCHVSVSDNGIGFEQEHSERIFELFQRLHGRAEYNGTGIGLAIVKRIVENHNGIIKARSEKDKGSVFDIYIPSVVKV